MSLSDQEFRREKRVTFTVRAPLGTGIPNEHLIEDSSTIDLSESGVRIRLRGNVEPGQVVEIYLGKRPEQCRVVWTTPGNTNKELVAGLEFICPLPDVRRPQTPSSSNFEPIN